MISWSDSAFREVPDLGPGLLIVVRSPLTERMDAPVDVGVVRAVILHQRVDNHLGFLTGGGVIEVDQRLAVDGLMEDWEISAHLLNVYAGADD